jgi:hypothetical protein
VYCTHISWHVEGITQTHDKKWEKADEGANGGQCVTVGVAHHLQVSSEICCSICFFWVGYGIYILLKICWF